MAPPTYNSSAILTAIELGLPKLMTLFLDMLVFIGEKIISFAFEVFGKSRREKISPPKLVRC